MTSDPQPSSRPYELLDVVGNGGQGVVYRARFTGGGGFARPVAIKVLSATAGGAEELGQRLRDEARILSRLHHRGIVQVFDLTVIDGRWAVVMELIEGADLRQIIGVGAVPPRAACEILAVVASALAAAHAAVDPDTGAPLEVVHRDVKPHNVRVTPAGDVKLLDFGISYASFAEREAVTRSLSFGTDGYLAPERFDHLAGPPVDVYALAVVGWEMVCGRPLGRLGVSPARHGIAVDAALAQLPQEADCLRPLLEAALRYPPEDRPTAAELARGVRALMHQVPGAPLEEWAPGAVAAARPRVVDRSAEAVRGSSADAPPVGPAPSGRPPASPPPDALLAGGEVSGGSWTVPSGDAPIPAHAEAASAPTLNQERQAAEWSPPPEPPPLPPARSRVDRAPQPMTSGLTVGLPGTPEETSVEHAGRPEWMVPVAAASLLGGTLVVVVTAALWWATGPRAELHPLEPVVVRSLSGEGVAVEGPAAEVSTEEAGAAPVTLPPSGPPPGMEAAPADVAATSVDTTVHDSSAGVRGGPPAPTPGTDAPPAVTKRGEPVRRTVEKPPPNRSLARLFAAGDADNVWFVDGDGRRWPGLVPPGVYRAEAEVSGRTIFVAGSVTVVGGESWRVRCDRIAEVCVAERCAVSDCGTVKK